MNNNLMRKHYQQQRGEHPTTMTDDYVSSVLWMLLWYILLGGLHEAYHWLCAYSLGVINLEEEEQTISQVLLQTLLGRQVRIPLVSDDNDAVKMMMIRHCGWLFSCLLAVILHATLKGQRQQQQFSSSSSSSSWRDVLLRVAYATALEAIVTDLLQFMPSSATTTSRTIFYCGNFGLIILNPAWFSSIDSALDILQTMIRVTMMRGAQAGGVVTFTSSKDVKAIRSRVVNRKRTDLSDKIMRQVRRDNKHNFQQPHHKTMALAGHTRFATSSIADFHGTHPHRWSPRAVRQVYNLQTAQVSTMGVENYVMHNGDFEFYELHGTTYDLEAVQEFLEGILCEPMPSTTDSCSIAGMIDVLRTQGCFALSARYALAVGMPTCNMSNNCTLDLPKTFEGYQKLGDVFDVALQQFFQNMASAMTPAQVLAATAKDKLLRQQLAALVVPLLLQQYEHLIRPLVPFHISAASTTEPEETDVEQAAAHNSDDNDGDGMSSSLLCFARTTIDAFFDNDLLQTTKMFLTNAHGSFGLCVTSSLDASSQLCLAARGQTISIGFYPKSGLILYGSEQAAVKAALNVEVPNTMGGKQQQTIDGDNNQRAVRLDLDDLGGEICLLDWKPANDFGIKQANNDFVSAPNRHLPVHAMMNNTVRVVLCQQQQQQQQQKSAGLFHRMTLLEGNEFIQPLAEEPKDLVLSDIQSIPRVCQAIQKDWQNEGHAISFNRLTALNLSRCLVRRLDAIAATGQQQRHPGSVDILLTGCEVSLWLAEQMAADLQKAFTKLNIIAVSSNKLLGLFGQEQSIPALGFPMSRQTHVLTDSIVIIISHSGGTFGPLQCSNLLQSVTRNIFAVTSEWDCQIGKQLRTMYHNDRETLADGSRLFTTGVGLAPAEPCSLSVAATQQLLTNIFEHMCIVGISNPRFRHVTGAVITERDLQILERCNRDNIRALEAIVGVDVNGNELTDELLTETVRNLRAIGDRWSEHVLENAKAYIMSFVYIVVTVTTGWPLISALGHAAGAGDYEWIVYILRFLDSLLYFWLPQINITILRLIQGRDLLHRMVGRTVVIGDCPWVAQSAEAFLSKLFACSYSIAGLNVHSANPADHLVHRQTHRVVRGTLLVCGRPDGRLMSLTSLESSVLLSVNQASSIQSFGGRCESVTIGHNPFDNPLCYKNVFLERHRPLFLCERVLDMTASPPPLIPQEESASSLVKYANIMGSSLRSLRSTCETAEGDGMSGSFNSQTSATSSRGMSSSALLGKYSTLQKESKRKQSEHKEKKRAASINFFERIMATATEKDDILTCSRHGRLNLHHFDTSRHGSRHGKIQIFSESSGHFREWSSRHGRRMSMERRNSIRDTTKVADYLLPSHSDDMGVKEVLAEMRLEQTELGVAQRVFDEYDTDNDGFIDRDEFLAAYKFIDSSLTDSEAIHLFEEADLEDSGELSFEEFLRVLTTPQLKLQAAKNRNIRDHVGLVSIKPSEGKYFDHDIYQKDIAGISKIALARSECLSMELYEARIASLQRFVSMTVMFHQLAQRVQSFFVTISFGLWGYRMDRTQSILRVATTASPASGAHVRTQMEVLRVFNIMNRAVNTISGAWARYKARKVQKLLLMQESLHDTSQKARDILPLTSNHQRSSNRREIDV